ncbi:MAG: dynamin family protein [Pseudomonadota bacterium]
MILLDLNTIIAYSGAGRRAEAPADRTGGDRNVPTAARAIGFDMYRENYIKSLRKELLALVEDHLTPVALAYGYSETPLESNIKWRPQVLVLGNYSSGKSTLINEFLGADIQGTGQAPTDDSFTIITYADSQDNSDGVQVTETRDGKYLLNDPEYPFEALKRHGQRFASHFRMKKVNSPFLRTLSIIDTPGMLDSITERDRGYNYQDVIGDLAQISDLVLILFDPHKAGTVREAHASLRDTLPAKTFEDRVLFVLNRIDECASLTDLLRVYGTLCWNLSQMTGRKDIPMIHLTYSPRAAASARTTESETAGYLQFLENQREDLKKAIHQAPKHRLDNLAAFVETHSERLTHLLEALSNYRLRRRAHQFKAWITAGLFSLLASGASALLMLSSPVFAGMSPLMLTGAAAGVSTIAMLLWWATVRPGSDRRFHRRQMTHLDTLTPLGNQTRRDTWQNVKDMARAYLEQTSGRFSTRRARQDYATVNRVFQQGSREIREALNELSTIRHDGPAPVDPPTPAVVSFLKKESA